MLSKTFLLSIISTLPLNGEITYKTVTPQKNKKNYTFHFEYEEIPEIPTAILKRNRKKLYNINKNMS